MHGRLLWSGVTHASQPVPSPSLTKIILWKRDVSRNACVDVWVHRGGDTPAAQAGGTGPPAGAGARAGGRFERAISFRIESIGESVDELTSSTNSAIRQSGTAFGHGVATTSSAIGKGVGAFGEGFGAFGSQLGGGVGAFGSKLGGGVGAFGSKLGGGVGAFREHLGGGVGAIGERVGAIGDGVGAFGDGVGAFGKGAIGTVPVLGKGVDFIEQLRTKSLNPWVDPLVDKGKESVLEPISMVRKHLWDFYPLLGQGGEKAAAAPSPAVVRATSDSIHPIPENVHG